MANKTRVLEAIRQGMVGGGETHVYDLSTRLNKGLYTPIVLSFTDGEMVAALKEKEIETHVIHTTKPFDPRVVKKVIALIKEKKIDIVHAHGTRAASNVIRAARKLNIPVIYTVHGWSFNDSQSKIVNTIRKKFEQYITSRTTVNICVSESNRQTGLSFLKNFTSKVIYNGISLDKFNFDIDGQSVIKEIDKKEGEVWIGFIARMTFQKDPLTLLEAFYLAKKKKPNLKLLMVGSGELEQDVNQYIESKNLRSEIKILPFRKDIPEILSAIDIYCLPSLWEGLPIGVLEAMAMKKPIIATNVDGTKEIVDPSNGILVNTKDTQKLSEALHSISASNEVIKSLGEKGYDIVCKEFLIDDMVAKTELVYSELQTK